MGARPLPAFLLVPRDNLQYYKWTIGSGKIVRLTRDEQDHDLLGSFCVQSTLLCRTPLIGTKFIVIVTRHSKKFSLKIERTCQQHTSRKKFRISILKSSDKWSSTSCRFSPQPLALSQSEARSLFFSSLKI